MGSGDKQEREVTNAFREAGWFARRATSSGGGTKQASYDVMAAKDGTIYVGEVKYRDPDEYIYIEESEVEDLEWCADHLGGLAVLIARWKRDTSLYAYFPEQLTRTDAGTYKISSDEKLTAAFEVPPDKPFSPNRGIK
jgi:Holliday junction resolvase